MSSSDEDGELDPAMERVRRKLARLLLVSSGVMVLGLLAVVIAIVYRLGRPDAPVAAAAVTLDLAAADLVAATVADGSLVLTIGGAAPRIEVRRLADGSLIGRFDLAPARPLPSVGRAP